MPKRDKALRDAVALVTQLRNVLYGLTPYFQHLPECETLKGWTDQGHVLPHPCTCGLEKKLLEVKEGV